MAWRRAVLALLLLLGIVPAATATAFVPGTEDVPLMPGLTPIESANLVFDKPEGRIVEAKMRGKTERSDVRAFYRNTLPQLGWTEAGADAWRRNGEMLRLDFGGHEGDLTVGFTLSPQQESHP